MSIRLIASDLDGTLLTDCKELSPKTREVLDLAVQHGIYIVPATGRSFYSIPEMIRNYPGVEYVITANGGAVYSVREGKRVYQCLLEKESVESAIAVRKRENMVLEVVIDGVPYAEEAYVKDPMQYLATEYGAKYIKATRKPEKISADLHRNMQKSWTVFLLFVVMRTKNDCILRWTKKSPISM